MAKSFTDRLTEAFHGITQQTNKNKGVALRDRSDMDKLKNGAYITPSPEIRQMMMRYIDPLSLNFRLLLNINQREGLLAGANKVYEAKTLANASYNPLDYPVNSALAYFLRVGEYYRFNLLFNWIIDLIDLIKNYEFLVESIDGLQEINSTDKWAAWVDASVTVTFRETVDHRVQRVLSTYHEIWYDDERGVVVLPNNLQRIDISVLIFNSGYYNRELYDMLSDDDYKTDPQRVMFPTIRKLSQLDPLRIKMDSVSGWDNPDYPFIYHIFRFPSAHIKQSTGSGFFDNVSNEPSNTDMVKTKLIWEFWGVQYSNSFNGSWKDKNFFKLLQMAKVTEDYSNIRAALGEIDVDGIGQANTRTSKSWVERFGDSWKNAASNVIDSTVSAVTKPIDGYIRNSLNWLESNLKPITDPSFLAKELTTPVIKLMKTGGEWWQNTLDEGITSGLTKLMGREVTKQDVEAFLRTNFTQQFIDNYHGYEEELLNKVRIGMGLKTGQNTSLPNSPKLLEKENINDEGHVMIREEEMKLTPSHGLPPTLSPSQAVPVEQFGTITEAVQTAELMGVKGVRRVQEPSQPIEQPNTLTKSDSKGVEVEQMGTIFGRKGF